MKQSVGWGDREGCGGGRVGDNELICSCTGGVEVMEVIRTSHGMVIQVVEVSQSASSCWMEEINAAVRSWIGWLGGGGGRLMVVEVGEVF